VTYPVYNITNQAFVYNFDAGYQITYTDSNTMKLRTGMWVAMIFNHTANAYQYDNVGTYFVYIYPIYKMSAFRRRVLLIIRNLACGGCRSLIKTCYKINVAMLIVVMG
jgi:hypothetical protein